MANKPRIRFRGFTEDWEQRKFLDLLDTQNGIRRGPFGSSLKKDSFVKKSDYVVYEQQNAIYDNYVTRYFISKEKYNELIRFNIQPGDFIMSGAGTIGRISMVPDGIKKGVFNQALIRFKVDKNSVNPLYFLKFMQSDMMQKQLTQANPGSAMTNLVPMDELKKWDVTIPSLEEQNKISNFINQIDESITLHQCKLKKLNLAKKSLLQKLFPRNGSQIPGVRFKGFTDAWEQRKLGDLAEIVRGASPRPISDSKWFDNNSDVGWLRISDVTAQDGRIQYLEQKISKLGQDKTRVVKTPHLLLSIAATVGKPVINYVPTGVHDGFLIFLNPKFNILYAFWWLEIFREEWNKYGQPGSQVNLNSDLVKNQVINIPNEKEQEKISSFLEALDRIITLHQRKLERLQEVKKGLLQKMFV
ncbi:MAG: restriction endonuclease subunit S [Veillonella sp.]|uniref:restriction endonuclease subunit S n=1 Tax=Veillonella sp. TaxID=1926307 RepID=UPI0029068956|nr:restriction endonuclease subunit S [Veillonella sp.]MDU5198246.1 restriction endonuclease subunit S [Veillonella sp.]MDU5253530.1 restriction endonuclease subunit S [Veillonella sp.]MDU5708563.1 restriction endonuclease subunit S [Veillonella sp.]MDU5734130.1 restriction endonuclease subunit S [Veillonella sp.]MDU5754189.1 restriction endonuclease subunit S [Veillonella sp.]